MGTEDDTVEDSALAELVRLYAQGDAEAGFRLWDHYRPTVEGKLRRALGNTPDAEDCASSVLLAVLRTAGRFRNPTVEAFAAFLSRCTRNEIVESVRQARRSLSWSELGDAEEPALEERLSAPGVDVDAAAIGRVTGEDADAIYQHVDRVLLGLPEDESTAIALLALEMVYLEQRRVSEVIASLSSLLAGTDRARLEGWLKAPGLIGKMAYEYLYMGAEEIAEAALSLARASAREEALGDAEERVIVLHYQYGLPVGEQEGTSRGPSIVSREDIPLAPEAVEQVLATVDLQSHLRERAAGLASLLQEGARRLAIPDICDTIGGPVWQRLTFQYYYGAQERSQEQTWQLVSPLAEAFGQRVTRGDINNWTSGRRLLRAVLRHITREHPEFVAKLRALFNSSENAGRTELMLLTDWPGMADIARSVGPTEREREAIGRHLGLVRGRAGGSAGRRHGARQGSKTGGESGAAIIERFQGELFRALRGSSAAPGESFQILTDEARAALDRFRADPAVQRARAALSMRYGECVPVARIADSLGVSDKEIQRLLAQYESRIVAMLCDQVQSDLRR